MLVFNISSNAIAKMRLLNGMVARLNSESSQVGVFLNEYLDRANEVIYYYPKDFPFRAESHYD